MRPIFPNGLIPSRCGIIFEKDGKEYRFVSISRARMFLWRQCGRMYATFKEGQTYEGYTVKKREWKVLMRHLGTKYP